MYAYGTVAAKYLNRTSSAAIGLMVDIARKYALAFLFPHGTPANFGTTQAQDGAGNLEVVGQVVVE